MQFDFIYSDPHYAHFNIIKYCDRPFKDAEHMREEFIRNYNLKVKSCNAVLWLGDCFFKKQEADDVLKRLNGAKWLLRGNHDKGITDLQFLKAGFEAVFSQHFVSYLAEIPVRFSHYPYAGYSEDKRYPDRRPPKEKDIILIHGHTHEKCKITPKSTIHVGVDAWDYAPASFDEVYDLAKGLYEKI
jgi:calcineurin-like phosphoesterase family protein